MNKHIRRISIYAWSAIILLAFCAIRPIISPTNQLPSGSTWEIYSGRLLLYIDTDTLKFRMFPDAESTPPLDFWASYRYGKEGEISINPNIPISSDYVAYIYGSSMDSITNLLYDINRYTLSKGKLLFHTPDNRAISFSRK